jgi:hypothetical protein
MPAALQIASCSHDQWLLHAFSTSSQGIMILRPPGALYMPDIHLGIYRSLKMLVWIIYFPQSCVLMFLRDTFWKICRLVNVWEHKGELCILVRLLNSCCPPNFLGNDDILSQKETIH